VRAVRQDVDEQTWKLILGSLVNVAMLTHQCAAGRDRGRKECMNPELQPPQRQEPGFEIHREETTLRQKKPRTPTSQMDAAENLTLREMSRHNMMKDHRGHNGT
jgi:hypothetical protein